MNKRRRQSISKLRDKLTELCTHLDTVKDELSDILDEENESRDNMPESLEESQRYYDSEEASEILEANIDELIDIQEQLNDVIDELQKIE